MRAWKSEGQTQLLAVLLTIGCCLAPQIADCQEPVVSNVRTESIPVSNIPLPLMVCNPAQKPTSALYSDQSVIVTELQIGQSRVDAGTQKCVQTKLVSADCISAPESVELPPCEVPIAVVKQTTAGHHGDRKPFLNAVPVHQEIVRVQWNIAPTFVEPQTVSRTGAQFQTEYCPFVRWESDETNVGTDESEIGFCSELVAGEISTGKAQLTSVVNTVSANSNLESLAELRKLLPMPQPEAEVTYLTELNQLLQGDSNWLFANERLLDLTPEEGSTAAVSYLDDLNALVGIETVVSSDTHYLNTVAAEQAQTENSQNGVPSAPKNPGRPFTGIAPEEKCHGAGGGGVSGLFQSMSSIRLNGLSTDPPVQPRNSATLTAELARPSDQACQYMDPYSPAYYSTPVRYGAPRPCRDTHVFLHRPLYYEDPNLERCGQTSGCITTAVSAVHFATAIAFTPYLMAVEHPASCVRSLPDCPTCHSFD